jgi:hypothetical protein
MMPVGRQGLELPWSEVEAIHHALLDHVDKHLETRVSKATVQEVEELHVWVVINGEYGLDVGFNGRILPVRLSGHCNATRAALLDAQERVRE